MRRSRYLATVIVLVLLASCGGDDGAERFDIVGTWTVAGDGEDAIVTYSADGTYEIRAVTGATEYAFDRGTYRYDGDTIVFTSAALSRYCREGQEGTYRVEQLGDDGWSVAAEEEECRPRAEGTPFVHTPRS